MKLRIPSVIYTGALIQAHTHLLSVYFLLAVFMAESRLRWHAKGDYAADDPNRFPGDPYWQRNEQGLFPHSYGLGQLHVDGAGSGKTPAQLLDITNNIALSGRYLATCLQATGGSFEDAASAYNQGIHGWQTRGRGLNQRYVDAVMAYYDVLVRAEIEVVPDVGGEWVVEVDE